MATVRYFAAAGEAAGRDEEVLPGNDVAAVRAAMVAAHGDKLERVLQRCSLLVDGLVSHEETDPVGERSTVDVLPPFAGG